MASAIPTVMHRNLSVIQHWVGEYIILGASNLCGRFWTGSIWCFKHASDAPDIEKSVTGAEVEAGICDAITLNQSSIMIGLDSGAVEILDLQTDPDIFDSKFYSCEHDDVISSLSLNSGATQVVSSSFDRCIKVWDLDSMSTVATYRPAHGNIVWRVSCCSVDPNVFLSCGQDSKLLLWDLRLPKPATILSKGPLSSIPTAVAWQPESLTTFAVGDETGEVLFKDLRNDSTTSYHCKPLNRRVYRLVFSTSSPSWLAACGDETQVVVIDYGENNGEIIYCNDSHTDFVQGISWGPDNQLYSCGWDQQVLPHAVSGSVMEQT